MPPTTTKRSAKAAQRNLRALRAQLDHAHKVIGELTDTSQTLAGRYNDLAATLRRSEEAAQQARRDANSASVAAELEVVHAANLLGLKRAIEFAATRDPRLALPEGQDDRSAIVRHATIVLAHLAGFAS